MIKILKTLIFITLISSLSACASLNSPKLSASDGLSADYKAIVYDNIINAAHQKHLRKYGGVNYDLAANQKLRHIIQKLISSNPAIVKNVNPILMNSPDVNAYSLSSQSTTAYVYVTVGLLKFIDNDHQLASVLAHEIAHIQLDHHLLRRKNSAAQFNQAQELAADKHSIQLIINAGYRPSASINLLKKLDVLQAGYNTTNQADYPTNTIRIHNLKQVISAI